MSENIIHILPEMVASLIAAGEVDPDGREIVIGGILDKILNFWGLDDYVDKVRNDLITLKNIDPELNKLISVIESSKTKYYIYPTSENEGNSYDVQNNTIYYNPDNNTGVGGERPAIVGTPNTTMQELLV